MKKHLEKLKASSLVTLAVGFVLGMTACQGGGQGQLEQKGKIAAGLIVDAITDRVLEEIESTGGDDLTPEKEAE
tara:strand:+ start:2654 stop:2875 length:222 start_codon:yes stop_codon:yes gene_type:complete